MARWMNNGKNLAIIAVLIFLVACSSTPSKKERQANIYFGAGTQSLMTQDYTDALANLLKANELNPEHPGILTNLGMAYYFKNEKEMAIKILNQAIKIDKDNSDAKLNLASIYFNDGDYSQAEKIYKQVLKNLTYEKQARTYYNLGLVEQKKNNLKAAYQYFEKSVKEDGNYCPGFFQLGVMDFDRRQFNKALKNFKDASMGTCTEAPAPIYYQALTFIELKRFNEARVKLDEIDAKFGKSEYALKARRKMVEVNQIEQNHTIQDSHASRKMFESPEF